MDTKLNLQSATNLEYIVGLFSVFVFLYRALYIMIPMMYDGFKKNNLSLVMKSLTMLV